MDMIYFDNAATSFPKPAAVGESMLRYITDIGATVNRASYGPAQETGMRLFGLREKLCALFGFDTPQNTIITSGATAALNMAIKGFLRPGDHCIVSSMEHNAVMRPLRSLEKRGVSISIAQADKSGRLSPESAAREFRENTRLFVLCHASNVSGTVQDAYAIGRLCGERGVHLLLDAAQSAGHVPIDFAAMGLSALAVPGHKGLLGPSGIGALLLREDFARQLSPLIEGGTGSFSALEEQPRAMPDRFEAGTPNIPGIYGLDAALDFLLETGTDTIRQHESALLTRFLRGVSAIPGVRVVGAPDTAAVSLDFPGRDNAECADRLAREHGVLTRCGLHCAPLAHKTLDTLPRGTVRFSMGYYTTLEDIDKALYALSSL